MDFRMISQVTFHKLDSRTNNHRGRLATFDVVNRADPQYARGQAIKVIQLIGSLLTAGYRSVLSDENFGQDGEQLGIIISQEKDQVHLTHRYWSTEQLAAFKAVVLPLARLHGWIVWDESDGEPKKIEWTEVQP